MVTDDYRGLYLRLVETVENMKLHSPVEIYPALQSLFRREIPIIPKGSWRRAAGQNRELAVKYDPKQNTILIHNYSRCDVSNTIYYSFHSLSVVLVPLNLLHKDILK